MMELGEAKKSIIFFPVGKHRAYHPEYDSKHHWMSKDENREYEIAVSSYKKDFIPNPETYDYLIPAELPKLKFQMVKHFLDNFDYSKYEYIGLFDDDLVTDVASINRSLQIARENDLKIFQMSLLPSSKINHPITEQNKNLEYTITNFTEIMCPFYHVSLIDKILKLWEYHDFVSGWGLDCILSDVLKVPSAIIHETSVYHKPEPSNYDRAAAHAEMIKAFQYVYPAFMKDVYGEVAVFKDDIKVIKEVPRV